MRLRRIRLKRVLFVFLWVMHHTPEMTSGIILRKLIEDGEGELHGKITQAVVTPCSRIFLIDKSLRHARPVFQRRTL